VLKIRLQRKGRKNRPFYRIVVAEHSFPVQGRFIEILGHYNPLTKEVVFKKEQVLDYLSKGAQPSQTIARLGAKNGISELESYIEKRFTHAKKEVKKEEAA
jgi:small subunit ribosomal protein S16